MFQQLLPLILASESPRRKQMLEELGLNIFVVPSGIIEAVNEKDPIQVPSRIANLKMQASVQKISGAFEGFILVADTVVTLENKIFGKPKDKNEAIDILNQLSGKTHKVVTCFRIDNSKGETFEQTVCTWVTFKSLSTKLIQSYVNTGEPMDKAGAYGIQGLGGVFIEKIEGSYSNVVGLPMAECAEALLHMKVIRYEP